MMDESKEMETIRDTPFGDCIGATILDITTGEGEDDRKVFFHLSNGVTFFATISYENDDVPPLVGFVVMERR